MTPDGERLNQRIANQLSLQGNLLLICGHYRESTSASGTVCHREISIGDYVLSGESWRRRAGGCHRRLLPVY